MHISPIGWLLKFGDVRLQEVTVAEVSVQLAVLVDEFLDEVDGRHGLAVLGETTREPPATTTQRRTARFAPVTPRWVGGVA